MTTEELVAIGKDLALATKEYVTEIADRLAGRVTSIEDRIANVKDGRDGKDGEFGPIGPQGPKGDVGEIGLVGQVGPVGDPGSAGPSGLSGKDGSGFHCGHGAPMFVGRSGDVYLDAESGDLYRCL